METIEDVTALNRAVERLSDALAEAMLVNARYETALRYVAENADSFTAARVRASVALAVKE